MKLSLTSVHTVNSDPVGGRPRGQRLLSVGKTFYSAETQLADRNDKGEGEFCMRGRGVMMGYLNCEDKTLASYLFLCCSNKDGLRLRELKLI